MWQISQDNSQLAEAKKSNENLLRILQIRFAKGEISKEEYEEMRKMIEP